VNASIAEESAQKLRILKIDRDDYPLEDVACNVKDSDVARQR
jgi:hypothetical protein